MSDIRLLCVEPDESARVKVKETLQTHLADLNPVVEVRGSLTAAEAVFDAQPVDCLVTEYDLPDGTGLELIDHARTRSPDTGGILFTAASYDAIDTTGFEATITDYLAKDVPQASTRLADVVRTTVTRRSQLSYPLPEDEPDRIAALGTYEFDSARLHQALERLTELAAQHFDLSGVEVNLIEEHHQQTLVAHGASAPGTSTARAASICTFTILEADGVLVVEDVYDDPRFKTRGQQFEARGVRSYLGARLSSSAGPVLGTVCIYDEEPRSFPQADEAYLRNVAAVAMALIEGHARRSHQTAPSGSDEPGDPEGDK